MPYHHTYHIQYNHSCSKLDLSDLRDSHQADGGSPTWSVFPGDQVLSNDKYPA